MLLLLTGCATLKINRADNIGMKITKGFGRTLLAISTIGYSEIYYKMERTMKSWLGHNDEELMMSWGPPNHITSTRDGGKIITYTQTRSYTSTGHAHSTTTATASAYGYGNYAHASGQANTHTTYTPAQTYSWAVYRQFRVNKYGKIISYSWKGL